MIPKKKLNIFLVPVIYGFLLSGIACFAREQSPTEDAEMLFYGKVVDQYYKPVVDADVHVDILKSDINKIKATKSFVIGTDEKGLFAIKDRGCSIDIRNIEKDGYEFLYHKNLNRSFEYSSAYPEAVYIPDRNAPLIFHIQKIKDEPAYLIHQSSLARNFPPARSSEYGLNLGGSWINDNGEFQEDSKHLDLKIKCNVSEDQKQFELSITSMDSNSGILTSDEFLEEAPADGYEPKIVLEINIPERYEERKTYIYAKARGGQMYSRLDLELTVRPSNLLVSMDIWTNPENSRNLKYNKEFQKYVKKKRYDVREHHYQEHLRAVARKERFRYESRNTLMADAKKLAGKKGQNRGRSYGDYYYRQRVYRRGAGEVAQGRSGAGSFPSGQVVQRQIIPAAKKVISSGHQDGKGRTQR